MSTNEPAIAGKRSGGGTLARGLATLLILDGFARLIFLVYALGRSYQFLRWPVGRLDSGYFNTTVTVLAYALLAAVPIWLGAAFLRGRPWRGATLVAVCIAAPLLDAYLAFFGVVTFGRLPIFGTTDSLIQTASAAMLLLAALVVLRPARADGAAAFRPSHYSRSAGLMLAFLGLCQIILPDSSLGSPNGYAWDIATTLWRFAPFSNLFLDRLQIAVDVLAHAGTGVAALICGVGLMGHATWARPAAIVVCLFGAFFHLLGAGHLSSGGDMLGTSYGLWMVAIQAVLVAARPQLRRPRHVAAAMPSTPDQIVSAIPDGDGWRAALLASLNATGVAPPQPGWMRRVLIWTLPVAVGLATSLFAHFGLPSLIQGAPVAVQYAALGLWYLGGLFVISPILRAVGRVRKAMKAKTAADELASAGSRRPVLYLRSFDIDDDTARPSVLEFFGTFVATSTPEQKLAQELSLAGPVIAIGRPGESLPPLGAARFYVTDALWKQKVADVAKAAQLVVWTSGITEGLRWEVAHLLRSLPAEKLVLWAHPHLAVKRSQREPEWSLFRDTIGKLFPKPLPTPLGPTEFFVFAKDATPVRVEPNIGWLRKLARPFFGALVPSLKKLVAMRAVA